MRNVWNIVKKYINVASVFGLICFIFGVSFTLHQIISHMSCTSQTEGIISTFYHRLMGKDYPYRGLAYAVNGVEYSEPWSGGDSFAEGQTVTVVYNPSNPKKYYILEDKSNAKIVGIAFIIGGIVFTVIGYLVGANVLQAHYRL
jgi:hypothetical protein